MRISNWESRETTTSREISAEIDGFRLSYTIPPNYPFVRSGDPFIAAALLPAMAWAECLDVDPTLPVSPKLLRGIALLQEIHHAWNPALRIIPVRAKISPAVSLHAGAMSFFSGGVDSSFTLLKRRNDVSHLVHIHGFDFYTHPGGNGSFSVKDISNLAQLAHKIMKPWGRVAGFIKVHLTTPTLLALSAFAESGREAETLERTLAIDLDRIIHQPSFFERHRFVGVRLRPETEALLGMPTSDGTLFRLNRLLLEDAFPLEIAKRDDTPCRAAVERNTALAESLGKTLIPVTTNHYPFGYRYNLSRNLTQGSALASVALLLGFARAYVPAAYAYNQLIPLGSHPLTDPLWSTEGVTVFHDGAEARRIDKIICIATDPKLLANLRVCFEDMNDNCGHCPKCLRTAIPLALIGAANPPFPPASLPRLVRNLQATNEIERIFLIENYELAGRSNRPDLKKALRGAIRRYDRRVLLRDIDGILFGGRFKRFRRKPASGVAWLRRTDTTSPREDRIWPRLSR